MFGQNPVRKQEIGDGQTLWIKEVFGTIQEEGPLAGTPAVFVRLAGCHLRCHFCDTQFEDTNWYPSLLDLGRAIWEARPSRECDLVVLTGGEPLRQNVIPLIRQCNEDGFRVQVETAGSFTLPDLPKVFLPRTELAWATTLDRRMMDNQIVVSPKTPKLNVDLDPYIHALKYIIRMGEVDPEDGLPDMSTQTRGKPVRLARPSDLTPPFNRDRVFVQPCDEQDEAQNRLNLGLAAQVAMTHGYRLSVQQHKLAGLR